MTKTKQETKATRAAELTLEEYLEMPYHVRLVRDRWDDGREGWFAEVEELRGCMAQGETPDEAIANVRDAMAGWISVGLEDGHEIPEPRSDNDYSGRFLVRLPKSLHGELATTAAREGVSLNQFVTNALAGALGWRSSGKSGVHKALRQALDQLREHTEKVGRR